MTGIYRGLFLAALVHHEGRILVTGDDVVPMIDVNTEFSPATLSTDLYWLMKVTDSNACLPYSLQRVYITHLYSASVWISRSPSEHIITIYYTFDVLCSVHTTVFFTGREHSPRTRASFLDTREDGPLRSADAIVNDVIIIFYLQDGCPNDTHVHGPCSRARVVCTGL